MRLESEGDWTATRLNYKTHAPAATTSITSSTSPCRCLGRAMATAQEVVVLEQLHLLQRS